MHTSEQSPARFVPHGRTFAHVWWVAVLVPLLVACVSAILAARTPASYRASESFQIIVVPAGTTSAYQQAVATQQADALAATFGSAQWLSSPAFVLQARAALLATGTTHATAPTAGILRGITTSSKGSIVTLTVATPSAGDATADRTALATAFARAAAAVRPAHLLAANVLIQPVGVQPVVRDSSATSASLRIASERVLLSVAVGVLLALGAALLPARWAHHTLTRATIAKHPIPHV